MSDFRIYRGFSGFPLITQNEVPKQIKGLSGRSFRRGWKKWIKPFETHLRSYRHLTGSFLPSRMTKGKEEELVKRYYDRPPLNVRYCAWQYSEKTLLTNFALIVHPTQVVPLDVAISFMDGTTSPGILLKERYADLLSSDKETILNNIRPEMESVLRDIDAGLMPVSVFSAWLKNELLPREKVVKDKKCRLFMAGPADHVAISHTLFHNQNIQMYENCWPKTWIGIGIDKFHGFWHVLRRSMLHHRRSDGEILVCCMDGRRHDASCQVREFETVAFVRWMRIHNRDKYVNRVKYVYRNITNTVMVAADGTVFSVEGGNKSGQGNTTTDNCLIQMRRVIYALLLMNKYTVLTEILRPNPPIIILGDDVMMWSKEMTRADYNELARIVKEHVGAEWTTDFRNETNWEFCSHTPTEDTSYRLAAIPVKRIVSSVYRYQNRTHLLERLMGLLRESYPHSDLFEKMYLVAADEAKQHRIVLPSRDDIRYLWTGYQNRVLKLNAYSPIKNIHIASLPFLQVIIQNDSKMNKQIKNKNKQIQQLQQKLHQEKLKKRVDTGMSGTQQECAFIKELVMSMIDPDTSSGLRWPDTFSERTSTYKAVNNFLLPINESDSIQDYPIGSYYIEVHPEIDEPIRYLREIGTATLGFAYSNSGQVSNSNNFGFYLPEQNRIDSDPTIRIAQPDGVVRLGIATPLLTEDNVTQLPTLVGPLEASVDSKNFWYLPTTTSGDATRFFLRQNSPGSCVATLRQISNEGTELTSNTLELSGVGDTGNVSIFIQDSPRARFSWRLELAIENTTTTNVPAVVNIQSYDIFCNPKDLVYESVNYPDLTTLMNDFEKLRINAQSVLTTYVGASLTNAGVSSSLLYRGGIPASFNQVFNYDTVAQVPDSYSGAAKDGTYTYYEPMDPEDYSFRTIYASNSYRRPYQIHTGIYNGDNEGNIQGEVFRVKIVTLIEFTSTSQLYISQPSPVCPMAITQLFRVLSGVPNAMENGKHMDKLKRIASRVGRFIRSGARFGWDHRAELQGAAMALAPLLV